VKTSHVDDHFAAPTRRSSSVRRSRSSGNRAESWRDWAILTVVNHALLVAVVLLHPHGVWLLLAAVPLAIVLATTTLTVLHDAGHRRFSRHAWPNVVAVQTAAPVGFWVTHWTLKHRVHHRYTQVYPLDDATRSSGLVRLHPSAPRWRVHRYQHLYAWVLYGLAWVGELRSQLTFLRTGALAGIETPDAPRRTASFVLEKGLCAVVLLPYALLLGIRDLAVILVASMTLGSVIAAVVLVVGHINIGLHPTSLVPGGKEWASHLVRTTASFSTESFLVRWLTGG